MKSLAPALLAALASASLACGSSATSDTMPQSDAGVDGSSDAPVFPQTLSISAVDVLQTVNVPVLRDGAHVTTRNAPIVAGREGVLRVSVKPDRGWTRKSVRAHLELTTKGVTTKLDAPQSIGPQGSFAADYDTTFNFPIAKDLVGVDSTFSVSVTMPDGTELARYPADAGTTDTLDAKSSGGLKVKIVPVRWAFDGSHRLPDTSDTTLETYRAELYALYPVTSVDISVRDPIDWSEDASADGNGWDALLSQVAATRAADSPPPDVYYFGLFVPNASFFKYCDRGCVAGLSPLAVDPTDANMRVSIGLGYGDDNSASTMAHEIGHAHGRAHAPCGNPAQPDKKYPYPDGEIGVAGWDNREQKLIDPSQSDVMSYCPPVWISDYNYNALYNRVALVDHAKAIVGAKPGKYRMLRVDAGAHLHDVATVTLQQQPLSDPHDVTYVTTTGETRTVTGWYYAFDHVGGGLLLVPEPGISMLKLGVAGIANVQQVVEHAH